MSVQIQYVFIVMYVLTRSVFIDIIDNLVLYFCVFIQFFALISFIYTYTYINIYIYNEMCFNNKFALH